MDQRETTSCARWGWPGLVEVPVGLTRWCEGAAPMRIHCLDNLFTIGPFCKCRFPPQTEEILANLLAVVGV
jgi:hypothetical protein